ncbi:hypothetical protein LTR37_020323 [Vermiconidia calcicola]|uniref:Uncharacterized protein n=1 Tax=Vermiconidia calcicola TaxID=1690605 RepID=A0ACC3MBK7_9PEZI|nr:hypothetical protein LTR37_020323 [Vermiconidia calcicola]
MGKQIVYTKITPLPSNVPRQLALDLLHSHEEVIRMNPLVTDVRSIDPPRNAAADEFFSNWVEITEIITWGFGMKKKIQFKGVFHDQPWGMQSHVFAPLNTDMRQTYRIGGNQPGEPRESRELGVDTPLDGLYLREDVNIMCNTPFAAGFVKKEMKESSKIMIDRITRKAELLDEGKLHAMFEHGKLKTSKPSAEPTFIDRPAPSPGSQPESPGQVGTPFRSPALDSKGFGKYYEVAPGRAESVHERNSQYVPEYQQNSYQGPNYAGGEKPGQQQNFISELPGSFYQPQPQQSNELYPPPLKHSGQQTFRAELAGDTNLQPPTSQNYDTKPAPPTATHPAYQAYQTSPQPSPRLPSQGSPQPSPGLPSQGPPARHSSSSGYQVTNPDPPYPTENQRPNSYNNTVENWQRSVQSDQPIDDSYYRNARSSHQSTVEPDHQRFSKLSVQQSADDAPAHGSKVSKCPVCGLFEGDETAVSHHVTKAHFQ